MAMMTCKGCKAQISTMAKACPKCGLVPKKTSGCMVIFLVFLGLASAFFVLIFVLAIFSNSSKSPDASSTSQNTANAINEITPKPADPAVEAAAAEGSLLLIELRVEENTKKLKKYYASQDQISQATDDLIRLAVLKGYYSEAKTKKEKELGLKASKLLPKVAQQQRELYSSATEEIFIKSGMDVKVTARGKDKTQLRIEYVLMSQPLVYKFQNEIKIGDQARAVGFKKIIFTNGFDSSLEQTWTVDL
jgi:hypothetical protein